MNAGLKQALRITAVSVICTLLFIWGDFSISVSKCDAHEAEIFPMPHYDDLSTVPVAIGDEEYLFVLDTGFTLSAVDSKLVHILGEPIKKAISIQDAGGRHVDSALFHPPRAFLGTLEIEQNASVLGLDLSLIRSAMGRDVKGILGMPFFRSSIVQIDFDQRQIRVFPSSTEPKKEWGKKINVIETDRGLPEIAVRFGSDWYEPCVVDLGFFGTAALRPGLFEDLLQTGSITQTGNRLRVSLGGMSEVRQGLLAKCIVPDDISAKQWVGESRTKQSIIGIDYLRRYLVTFDLGKQQIFLSKGRDFDEPEDDSNLGLAALRLKGKTVIKRVVSDGLAVRSGFRVDDELIAVAGNPIANKPISEIYWMLETAIKRGEYLTIDVQRKGKVHSLRLAAHNHLIEVSKKESNSTDQVLHK